MLPHIHKIDPDRMLFDLIAFDGTAGVQKAGILMGQHFPRCSVIVGLEHTVSLLFRKVMALRQMHEMCKFAKLVRSCIDQFLEYV